MRNSCQTIKSKNFENYPLTSQVDPEIIQEGTILATGRGTNLGQQGHSPQYHRRSANLGIGVS